VKTFGKALKSEFGEIVDYLNNRVKFLYASKNKFRFISNTKLEKESDIKFEWDSSNRSEIAIWKKSDLYWNLMNDEKLIQFIKDSFRYLIGENVKIYFRHSVPGIGIWKIINGKEVLAY